MLFTMGPMGNMGSFGMFLIPLMIIALMLRDRGPVATFTKAGAISPETARRADSLKITRRYMLDGPLRRGVLVQTEDGRYWVDRERVRTLRLRLIVAAIIVTIIAGAVVAVQVID